MSASVAFTPAQQASFNTLRYIWNDFMWKALESCAASPACAASKEDVRELLAFKGKQGPLELVDGALHPEVFETSDSKTPRTFVVRETGAGWVTQANSTRVELVDFFAGLGLLIHELGHHAAKPEHLDLDALGSQVSRFVQAQSRKAGKGEVNVYTFPSWVGSHPKDRVLIRFADRIDDISDALLAHVTRIIRSRQIEENVETFDRETRRSGLAPESWPITLRISNLRVETPAEGDVVQRLTFDLDASAEIDHTGGINVERLSELHGTLSIEVPQRAGEAKRLRFSAFRGADSLPDVARSARVKSEIRSIQAGQEWIVEGAVKGVDLSYYRGIQLNQPVNVYFSRAEDRGGDLQGFSAPQLFKFDRVEILSSEGSEIRFRATHRFPERTAPGAFKVRQIEVTHQRLRPESAIAVQVLGASSESAKPRSELSPAPNQARVLVRRNGTKQELALGKERLAAGYAQSVLIYVPVPGGVAARSVELSYSAPVFDPIQSYWNPASSAPKAQVRKQDVQGISALKSDSSLQNTEDFVRNVGGRSDPRPELYVEQVMIEGRPYLEIQVRPFDTLAHQWESAPFSKRLFQRSSEMDLDAVRAQDERELLDRIFGRPALTLRSMRIVTEELKSIDYPFPGSGIEIYRQQGQGYSAEEWDQSLRKWHEHNDHAREQRRKSIDPDGPYIIMEYGIREYGSRSR